MSNEDDIGEGHKQVPNNGWQISIRGRNVKRSNRLHSTYMSDSKGTHLSSMTVVRYLDTRASISMILFIFEKSLLAPLTGAFISATSYLHHYL